MTSSLTQLLDEQRDLIVARFVAEVQREALAPAGVPGFTLVNHIPRFLDETVRELTRASAVRAGQDAADTSPTAREHGEQRWTLGYDLPALMREYGVLRHVTLTLAKETGTSVSLDEFDVLSKCLSVAVSEATSEYIRFRDQELDSQKANLEFLAEAGELLSSSLDYRSTLGRLTRLVIPRFADWVEVHIEGTSVEEMPVAHVDAAKAALIRDMYRRYPLPSDSPHAYQAVMRSGEPKLVASVAPTLFEDVAQTPEHLQILRTLNSTSWIIVPLRVQNNVFGAITLVRADSSRPYAASDVPLITELARRAAAAIDNAKLYELSQNERSRAEAATRAKDEFVAVLSHELRTPLNAILGWTRLLRGGSLPESKRGHALEVIERNGKAQSQMVADLLDISSVITGKLRINPAQVDLANIVELVIEGMRPAADAKRIQIKSSLDRANAVLRGDGDRLQQVVWNLLSNAVKFTPKGGTVEVQLRRVDSDIEISVQDDGEGIPAEVAPHVFETFRQSDSSATRRHGGLGIGLSIATHIVELHGGSIEVQSSSSSNGAIFVVRLPVAPLVSATLGVTKVPTALPEEADPSLPVGLSGFRVLVVDDEADARDLVALALESCGMEVHVAGSAADALKKLASWTPHVIVSDIGMPVEDGYALIRAIRTLPSPEKSRIPAIALTAFARNEDRTRALLEGFNQHLSKPVELMNLVKAVADLAGTAPG